MGAGLDHQTHVPPEGVHSENNPHYENGIVPMGPNDPKDSSHDHDSHSLADFDTSQVSVSHADEASASGEPISSIRGDSDSTIQSTVPNGDQVDHNNKTDIQNDAPKSPRTAPLQASDSLASIATDANGEDATFSPYASTILNDESQPGVGLIGIQDLAPLFGDTTPKPEDEPTEVPPTVASDSGGDALPHPIPQKPVTTEEKAPSANRLSISYAAGARRMVIDAEIVDSIRVFRAESRIEVHMNICKLETRFKGILVCFLSCRFLMRADIFARSKHFLIPLRHTPHWILYTHLRKTIPFLLSTKLRPPASPSLSLTWTEKSHYLNLVG